MFGIILICMTRPVFIHQLHYPGRCIQSSSSSLVFFPQHNLTTWSRDLLVTALETYMYTAYSVVQHSLAPLAHVAVLGPLYLFSFFCPIIVFYRKNVNVVWFGECELFLCSKVFLKCCLWPSTEESVSLPNTVLHPKPLPSHGLFKYLYLYKQFTNMLSTW